MGPPPPHCFYQLLKCKQMLFYWLSGASNGHMLLKVLCAGGSGQCCGHTGWPCLPMEWEPVTGSFFGTPRERDVLCRNVALERQPGNRALGLRDESSPVGGGGVSLVQSIIRREFHSCQPRVAIDLGNYETFIPLHFAKLIFMNKFSRL